MVRILNEIDQDTVEVMNVNDIGNNGNSHQGNLNIGLPSKTEILVHDHNNVNGKSKNHNNNCITNNKPGISTDKVDYSIMNSKSHDIASKDVDPQELSSQSQTNISKEVSKTKKCAEDNKCLKIESETCDKEIPSNVSNNKQHSVNSNGIHVRKSAETDKVNTKEALEPLNQNETDKEQVHSRNDNPGNPVIIIENVDGESSSTMETDTVSDFNKKEDGRAQSVAADECRSKTTEQTPDPGKTGKFDCNSRTSGKPSVGENLCTSVAKDGEGKTSLGSCVSTDSVKAEVVGSLSVPVNKARHPHHHHHHHHHHAHHGHGHNHNHHNHFNQIPNQHSHMGPHLHQANSQHIIPGLHVSQPVEGRCLFGNLEGTTQGPNLPFGVGGHPPQAPFNFFGEPKFESMTCAWNQFPPQPHISPSIPNQGGHGGPQIPAAPLPTALFPLPLDPACPPAVLPSHPVATNSSSGYGTTGHTRSSSPMAPTSAQTQGQTLMSVEAVTSCLPPPTNALLPNPTPAGAPGHVNPTITSPNHNIIFSASSSEIALYPHFPLIPGQYVVFFHINPGVLVSFHVGGDHIQVIKGPMTVPLVSTNSNPPIPLPMQVPQGHVVQQIVDENGTLRHVIVSHQPPLMPIPFGPGNQSQPFYPPGPGFPSHFPPMQGGGVPCGMPSSQGPPTPPGPNSLNPGAYVGHLPANAHKDERAQKQFVRLRRKFELKQQRDREMTSYTPSFYNNQNGGNRKAESGSYNNNNNNSQRRNVPNGTLKSSNGSGVEEEGSVGSTGSVTSTGTQDEEEESRVQAQTEMLSAIIPPVISDVASQSALIQWSHPDRFTESGENKFPELDVSDTDFRYDVHISDKSRDNRFKSIFVGTALSCRVKDLKPGTLYAISYCALLNDVRGTMSPATNFTTLPDVPEPPSSPRAVSRSRSTIQFKWNPVTNDNGSKVTNYILEYDEGKGGSHFIEAYRGKNKQFTISKLQPAYSYQFRLAAVNQCGQSRYSSTVTVMTAGSPPAQPIPPTITETGVTYLTLEWKCRPTDDEYALQMDDSTSGHGFLCVYNGNAPHYTCIGLKRNSQYKFRVKAQNEEGHSKWSDEVIFKTLPDRPGPPHKPGLKGRVHANSFKVRWESPSDDGGVPISAYALEIDQGNGGFEEIYRGNEMEHNIDKLSPGQSYALRVIAVGPGGESDPSEPCVITTDPVCPGKSNIPRIIGKPKSNSVHLKWSPPDWDGGSPVSQYEVGCTTPDNQTQEAYRGKETDCFVNRLLPGRAYLFQIRAFNRIGAGPWSDPLEVVSGPGAPDTPAPVKVQTKTAHMVILSWAEPLNNGSAITEYRVQMATVAVEPTENEVTREEENLSVEQSNDCEPSPTLPTTSAVTPTPPTSFCQVFLGSALSCEVKALQPASIYLFRVQAANNAGSSDWSPVTTHQMPASSPSAVANVDASASSDSISLSWIPPPSNGALISQYNVSIGEAVFVTTSNSYVVDNLMADTQYKIRVQAVNGIGPGPYSSVVKIATKPLPPPPPKLECVSVAHFWMKLKWSEITNKNIEYLIQMISPYQDEFQVVYRGSNPNCKVTRLAEDTQYLFRICALNGAGQGPFSDMYRFTTLKAPPPQVKGLKIELIKDSELCKFEWSEVACADAATYQLQQAKRRDQDFKTIFRGEEKKYETDSKDLEEGTEYTARVCAIRQCSDSTQLIGPYSNPVNFLVPLSLPADSNFAKGNSSFSSKNMSATSQMSSNLFKVIEEKMGNVSYESRVGIVAVFALIFLAFVISLITHHVVS